jgi:D-amino-acid dehydrogenase
MSKHVLVIGAGVIGLSTAYYCAQRGHRVTVIDRSPEEHDGCSFGNAGMVTPSHFVPLAAPGMVALGLKWMWNPESPFYIKPRLNPELWSWGWKFMRASNAAHVERSAPLLRDFNFAGRQCFEELAAVRGNDFGLVTRGLVMLCKTQEALDHEGAFAQQANALGVPAEVLDARELAKLDPNVTMDVAGGIYFPRDCHMSPARFMAALKEECDQLGVAFHWNSAVASSQPFTCDGKRIKAVRTAGAGAKQWEADEIVLAAGSWSPGIAQELGLKLPLQAGKGYSLTLPQPPELPQICSILAEARVAVTPMGKTLRFGGTMEIAGLNEDINPVRVRGIIKAAGKYYPKFQPEEFDGIQPWRGCVRFRRTACHMWGARPGSQIFPSRRAMR